MATTPATDQSPTPLTSVPDGTVTLGAFRGWPDGHKGQAWRAVMETDHPAALDAAVAQMQRAGLIVNTLLCEACDDPDTQCHAALDALDADGVNLADWCIPTREAFDKVAGFLGLTCTAWDALPDAGIRFPLLLEATTPSDEDPAAVRARLLLPLGGAR